MLGVLGGDDCGEILCSRERVPPALRVENLLGAGDVRAICGGGGGELARRVGIVKNETKFALIIFFKWLHSSG